MAWKYLYDRDSTIANNVSMRFTCYQRLDRLNRSYDYPEWLLKLQLKFQEIVEAKGRIYIGDPDEYPLRLTAREILAILESL